jgi:hypothetical protein
MDREPGHFGPGSHFIGEFGQSSGFMNDHRADGDRPRRTVVVRRRRGLAVVLPARRFAALRSA